MPNIEYYESSEDAPFQNWHKFNSFIGLKTAVGDDPNDMHTHINRAIGYANSADIESCIKELSNLRMNISYMQKERGILPYAMACMIKTIDGKESSGITQKELDAKVEILKSLQISQRSLKNRVFALKKKLITKLKSITGIKGIKT